MGVDAFARLHNGAVPANEIDVLELDLDFLLGAADCRNRRWQGRLPSQHAATNGDGACGENDELQVRHRMLACRRRRMNSLAAESRGCLTISRCWSVRIPFVVVSVAM